MDENILIGILNLDHEIIIEIKFPNHIHKNDMIKFDGSIPITKSNKVIL